MVGSQQRNASSRLSSGFRINSAADDAAGLGISETMRAQIRGLDQASRNSQDGISLIQTAEGALSTVNEMVTRIRELVVQSGNDTNTAEDRGRIQDEIEQLIQEIDSVSDRTEFNTQKLLNGGAPGAITIMRDEAIAADGITNNTDAQKFIKFLAAIEKLNALTGWELTDAPANNAERDAIITVANALNVFTGGAGTTDQLEALRAAVAGAGGSNGTFGWQTYFTNPANAAQAKEMVEFVAELNSFRAQLYDGGSEFTFQVGANSGQQITLQISNMNWEAISQGAIGGAGGEGFVGGPRDLEALGSDVADLLDNLDTTLGYVTKQRSELGAMQNRLEYTIENVDIASENLSAANSRIRDADMAKEMMRLTQANVLQQAATAMLAQANQAPQSVLQLLN
jgi:flagellin